MVRLPPVNAWMPQSNSELCLQKTSFHYVLADKYAANQQRGQLRIAMLAGDFLETLILLLLHSTPGLCVIGRFLMTCVYVCVVCSPCRVTGVLRPLPPSRACAVTARWWPSSTVTTVMRCSSCCVTHTQRTTATYTLSCWSRATPGPAAPPATLWVHTPTTCQFCSHAST